MQGVATTISSASRARDARTFFTLTSRMILVIIASTDCQPAPIPRLHQAVPGRFQAGIDEQRPSRRRPSIARWRDSIASFTGSWSVIA